jgi:hypothetical protein
LTEKEFFLPEFSIEVVFFSFFPLLQVFDDPKLIKYGVAISIVTVVIPRRLYRNDYPLSSDDFCCSVAKMR